jgi:hypothetical protein
MRTRGDLMFRSHLPASRLLRLRDALGAYFTAAGTLFGHSKITTFTAVPGHGVAVIFVEFFILDQCPAWAKS